MTNRKVGEDLAAALCNDVDARKIAGQEEAPLYDCSEPHVREYWRTIALAALRNATTYTTL